MWFQILTEWLYNEYLFYVWLEKSTCFIFSKRQIRVSVHIISKLVTLEAGYNLLTVSRHDLVLKKKPSHLSYFNTSKVITNAGFSMKNYSHYYTYIQLDKENRIERLQRTTTLHLVALIVEN